MSSLSVPRSSLCRAALAAAAFAALPAAAQQYPAKVVRVIVPFAPGGGSDISARRFSAKLTQVLGQQFVVDNRGGAAGLIGMELTAKAPPDGYTIMIMSGSFSATSATHKPAFDPINSIVAVAEFGITPFVLTVHPVIPAKSIKELVALGRAKPGDLTYANTGIGGMTHLATEYFNTVAKIKMVGVPYKSTGAGMADILSGQVPIIVGSLLPVVPHLKSNKLRALGVTTLKRWYSLPEVPAIAETFPGFDVVLWFGAMTPRGTPQPIIERLNGALNDILKMDDVKTSLDHEGMQATGGSPAAFGKRIRDDYERWVKLVKEANIVIK
ncbi:MAG: tripartite tricarboxylate transporter substrate binding protein [Burkholderiales bacterium]|nr:tripartite tricarboxylate transporter substrate binding protein [Burkholderiales bacterium]